MSRIGPWLVVCAALTAVGPAAAQPDPEPKDGKVTIPLSVSPTSAPRPANAYRLLPEYQDLLPGEKLSGFMKCFMEQNEFFSAEESKKRYEWLEMPLDRLPADVREKAKIKNGIAYNPPYANLMVFMDQAPRYKHLEWNEHTNIRHDGIYMLLPEIQKLRELASVLKLRMRGEIKNGEYARAIVTAQTLYGMAKMLEQHPTLIGNLVGLAVATIATHGLEEMIGQPNAPNLFWALSDLPSPLLELRTSLAGERIFLTAQFAELLHPKRAWSAEEIDSELRRLEKMLSDSGVTSLPNPRVRFAALAADAPRVEAARKRLAASGMPAELVKNLLPLHVVILEDHHRYVVLREEEFKWLNLPYPIAEKGLKEIGTEVTRSKKDSVFVPVFLPATSKVKQAQARLDQRIAFLRVIEAVRMHAQENGDKFPASLDEIRLPLPLDPVSGKPFEYGVKDGIAILHGANANPGNERTNRYYEIRLRK